MKRGKLLQYVGRIVVLDLVSRERPVCKITKISEDGVVSITNPINYMPVPRNGTDGETSYGIVPVPYAAPLFDVDKMELDCEHIISIIVPPQQIEQLYASTFGGIVTPSSPGLILPS
jgi:hypothetical protein